MTILTFPETLRSRVSEDGFPHVSFSMARKGVPEFTQIHLFVPVGIGSNDGMNYGSAELGIGGMVANAALNGDSVTTADVKSNVIKNTTGVMGAVPGIGGFAKAAELKSGLIVNPYTATTFEGVNVRQFEFAFKLVPTSAAESVTAHDIENAFRKYMYPKDIGAGSLEYPPTFRIKFMAGGKVNKYMPRIIDTYLTGMTASYNATGNSFHANDGKLGAAPVEVDLTLSFQEVRAITRDDLYGAGLNYIEGYETAGHVVGDSPDSLNQNKEINISNTGEG
tara:strand:- start:33 stop:869 length:837 start_codon:yes stop_codon:yes gene_type:complete